MYSKVQLRLSLNRLEKELSALGQGLCQKTVARVIQRVREELQVDVLDYTD